MCFYTPLCADLWLHGRNVRGMKMQEKGVGEDTQGICRRTAPLPLKWQNWTGLSLTLWLVHPRTHTGFSFFFFYLISLSNWFSEERLPPASLGNDSTYCVLSSKQVMLQLTQTYLVWWLLFEGGKELWQTVLLDRRIKAKDSNYAEARRQLFHCFVCLFMCVYATSPTQIYTATSMS